MLFLTMNVNDKYFKIMATQSLQYSANDFTIITDESPSISPLLVNTLNEFSFSVSNVDLGFEESLQISDVLTEPIRIVAAA